MRFWFGGVGQTLPPAESQQGQHHPELGNTWSAGPVELHNTVNIALEVGQEQTGVNKVKKIVKL